MQNQTTHPCGHCLRKTFSIDCKEFTCTHPWQLHWMLMRPKLWYSVQGSRLTAAWSLITHTQTHTYKKMHINRKLLSFRNIGFDVFHSSEESYLLYGGRRSLIIWYRDFYTQNYGFSDVAVWGFNVTEIKTVSVICSFPVIKQCTCNL